MVGVAVPPSGWVACGVIDSGAGDNCLLVGVIFPAGGCGYVLSVLVAVTWLPGGGYAGGVIVTKTEVPAGGYG
jgi:hypothetical protein